MRLLSGVFVLVLVTLPAVAQSHAFAKVTIKPARSTDPTAMRLQVLSNGDLIANGVPVIVLLSHAYDVPVDPSPRLSPVPVWAIRERYDIEARAIPNAVTPELNNSDSRARVQQEIRELLADRFRLAMRVENKSMLVYALTVARGGSKLQNQPSLINPASSTQTRKVAIALLLASATPSTRMP